MYNLQRHSQRITECLAVGRPRVCRSLKTMMDMDGAQRRQRTGLTKLSENMQLHGRIETAGERYMPGPGIAPGLEGFEKQD